ncbi:hypothetical protein TorRG33x02_069260 [Trema orientale]|uniref:Uncharacterized protein n=1 Tax=Trema orientale TaxID=63057 RepID=A0A2P5FH94_TREOI|nr:hypothetical protein TorRG33x02_069260 [Trema orientale]
MRNQLTVKPRSDHGTAGGKHARGTNRSYEQTVTGGQNTQRAHLASGKANLVDSNTNTTTKELMASSEESRQIEFQRAMSVSRDKQRGGNVFVLQATAEEFNRQLDFLICPCPANQYQPIQSPLSPPTGLCELGFGPKHDVVHMDQGPIAAQQVSGLILGPLSFNSGPSSTTENMKSPKQYTTRTRIRRSNSFRAVKKRARRTSSAGET